jgi:hypothetical protein
MKNVKCPNCDIMLPAMQLSSGWCEECGHKIPHFIYEEAGVKAAGEKSLAQMHWDRPQAGPADEPEDLPRWKIAAIGAAVIGIAAVIVRAFI